MIHSSTSVDVRASKRGNPWDALHSMREMGADSLHDLLAPSSGEISAQQGARDYIGHALAACPWREKLSRGMVVYML